jgi:hypothetical protein
MAAAAKGQRENTDIIRTSRRDIAMLNLILAVFWLLFAAVAFALPVLNPEARPWVIPGTEVSMGWFLLALSLYNVVRWLITRPGAGRRTPLRTLPRHSTIDEE